MKHVSPASTPDEPTVVITGVADAAHEIIQAQRFVELQGGGVFDFAGDFREGVEGHFTSLAFAERIPVSMKNLSAVTNVKNAFREMRDNVRHVKAAGVSGKAVLFVSLPTFTTQQALNFVADNNPNVLPEPGVFRLILLDCADGVVEISDVNIRRRLEGI